MESLKPSSQKTLGAKSSTDCPFDLKRLYESLSSCKQENGDISVSAYLDTYAELNRFFRMFGAMFGFVISDIKEKMAILSEYMESDQGSHYTTVQAMVTYEVANNITTVQHKKTPVSGCRTLLRLHRALEFVILLLKKLHSPDPQYNDKVSYLANDAYLETLAKHHPWLLRKGVCFAFHMLPTRVELLKRMGCQEGNEDMLGLLLKAVHVSQPVYDVVQEIYTQHKLLDLP